MVDDSTYWALRTVAVVQQVKKGVVVFRNLPLRREVQTSVAAMERQGTVSSNEGTWMRRV